jgi:SAM-dependent methyltransferase
MIRRGYLQRDYHRRVLDAEMERIAVELRGLRVVDLGGERIGRRGRFVTPPSWTCVNIDPATEPDIIADVSNTHLARHAYDAVVCTETLEHVSDPGAVVREAFYVLRPGGRLIISMPFLFPVHNDPGDYQRFTPGGVEVLLSLFCDIEVKSLGYFWSVLGDMVRWEITHWRCAPLRWVVGGLVMPVFDRLVRREMLPGAKMSDRHRAYSSGYWVEARKA